MATIAAAAGSESGTAAVTVWAWGLIHRLNDGLYAVWANDIRDVWVGGHNGIHHYDGSTWTADTLDLTVQDLWGSGPTDVWAVGYPGSIHHFDGTTWSDTTPVPTPDDHSFYSVWGTGPTDVWVLGASGYPVTKSVILHYDGTAWTDTTLVADYRLHAIWGSGPTDLWARGRDGSNYVLLHYDGSDWSDATPAYGLDLITDVWGTGPNDVWATVWAGAAEINLLHFDGTSWTDATPGFLDLSEGLHIADFVWGSGPADVWLVGRGLRHPSTTVDIMAGQPPGILHYDGTSWSEVTRITGKDPRDGWSDLWGTGPGDVWAIDLPTTTSRGSGIFHFGPRP